MMADKTNHPSCCECCIIALATCITCNRCFCWEHLGKHRQTYEKYLDNINEPLSNCLDEFKQIENKLYSDIDNQNYSNITSSTFFSCLLGITEAIQIDFFRRLIKTFVDIFEIVSVT